MCYTDGIIASYWISYWYSISYLFYYKIKTPLPTYAIAKGIMLLTIMLYLEFFIEGGDGRVQVIIVKGFGILLSICYVLNVCRKAKNVRLNGMGAKN